MISYSSVALFSTSFLLRIQAVTSNDSKCLQRSVHHLHHCQSIPCISKIKLPSSSLYLPVQSCMPSAYFHTDNAESFHFQGILWKYLVPDMVRIASYVLLEKHCNAERKGGTESRFLLG